MRHIEVINCNQQLSLVPNQLISFRLTPEEVALLRDFKQSGESDSLAVKRILLSVIKSPSSPASRTDNRVSHQLADKGYQQLSESHQNFPPLVINSQQLSSDVWKQIDGRFSLLMGGLEQRLQRLEAEAQRWQNQREILCKSLEELQTEIKPLRDKSAEIEWGKESPQKESASLLVQDLEEVKVQPTPELEEQPQEAELELDPKQKALQMFQEGMTQRAIARELGVNPSTVSRWFQTGSEV